MYTLHCVHYPDVIHYTFCRYTSSTMLRDDVVYATTHGFWLTGIPADIPLLLDVVPQLLPYEGAIRSLAINGE